MSRYFLELAYKGTRYSGFQVQENASTIQSEVENAFATLQRAQVVLTGSSRTDAGVHALQNYFHFDYEEKLHPQFIYKMNSILPPDIVIRRVVPVKGDAHSRFDAISRAYRYQVHRFKNPFLRDTSFYYPYQLDMERMKIVAELVIGQHNFFAFAKTKSQVKTFECLVLKSEWEVRDDVLSYNIESNRFLRGMVRLLTASQLKVGRHHLSVEEFRGLLNGERKCGYSVPSHGLFLREVKYPDGYLVGTEV